MGGPETLSLDPRLGDYPSFNSARKFADNLTLDTHLLPDLCIRYCIHSAVHSEELYM